MNENDNNFESLRRLLAQKRHELPPPGYFNSFSGQIIARIRAGEAKSPLTATETPWFLKLLQAFELKPAFAGAFASALSLLLVFGIIYAERPDSAPQSFFQASEQSGASFAAVSPPAIAQPSISSDITASNSAAASLQPVASLFGSQNVFAQPVSFSPSGN
ncbi:MAG: hypothetical protein PHY43_08865 [Verrucomicrobiales bacterium]|nr:hypothetical protein [Verrucomicrobiales bacterium]